MISSENGFTMVMDSAGMEMSGKGGVLMDMKIIKREKRICSCCMEEHEVKTVIVMNYSTFKNRNVDYEATYQFCDLAGELYMNEQQMRDNDISLKDAYIKPANKKSRLN